MRFFACVTSVAVLAACGSSYSAQPPPAREENPPPPKWTPPTNDPAPSGPVVREACGPVAAVFDDPRLQSFDQARARLDELRAKPPAGVPREQLDWCTRHIARLIAQQIAYQENVEAYRAIAKIANALRTAYAKTHALCPSAKPLPAELPASGATYQSTILDWTGDPGWSCVGFVTEDPQRFQYAVTADGDKFAIRARRRVGNEVITITLDGHVESDEIVFAPNVVESRAAAP